MIISSPRNMNGIRVTKHTLDRINERLGLSASKSDIASEYFSMMANRKVFFIPDYQADFLGKDADFIGKYFAIMEFLTIPIIIVIGVYDDGRHVMLTMYNFDENAEGDFKELYSKHKKLHPSEPAEIPIKPKNLRKDRNPNLVFKSSLYGKSI